MKASVFKLKDFRILLVGQTFSVLGDWFGIIAIIALAGFRWQVTPMQMSIVIISLVAPMFFFGPIGGVIADRVNRGKMMSLVCFIRAILLVFIANVTSFELLIVFLFCLGALDASFLPAKNAKLKEIPPPGLINDAVVYSSFIDQGARVFGPALGGSVLAFFSIQVSLYINAAAYLLSTFIFFFLSKTKYDNLNDKKPDIIREFKEGLEIMKKAPFVLEGALIQVFVIVSLQIVDSQFVILLRYVPGASQAWVGYCLMASGIGTIFATLFYVKRNKTANIVKTMLIGLFTYSFSVIGISFWGFLSINPFGFIPFFFIWGASGALLFVKYVVFLQGQIPLDYSGRAFGSLGSMLSVASMTGIFLGGVLVSSLGAVISFLVSGIILFIGSIYLVFRNKKTEII